jgi:hypothetical protein
VSLQGAVPDASTSHVAFDLTRRNIHDKSRRYSTPSHGIPLADGRSGPRGLIRIYVEGEALRQTQYEHMIAWGMDRSRRFRMLPCTAVGMSDFSLEEERECRAEMVYVREPPVVVVDSLSSISARGENDAEAVREVMAFLSNLARE